MFRTPRTVGPLPIPVCPAAVSAGAGRTIIDPGAGGAVVAALSPGSFSPSFGTRETAAILARNPVILVINSSNIQLAKTYRDVTIADRIDEALFP